MLYSYFWWEKIQEIFQFQRQCNGQDFSSGLNSQRANGRFRMFESNVPLRSWRSVFVCSAWAVERRQTIIYSTKFVTVQQYQQSWTRRRLLGSLTLWIGGGGGGGGLKDLMLKDKGQRLNLSSTTATDKARVRRKRNAPTFLFSCSLFKETTKEKDETYFQSFFF